MRVRVLPSTVAVPKDWQRLLTLTRLAVDVAMTGRVISDFTPFTASGMLIEMQQWGARSDARN